MTRTRLSAVAVWAVVLVLAGAAPALAQTGAIDGSVTFSNLAGGPYPPAEVVLLLDQVEVDQIASSRTDGTFSFSGLADGSYEVVVDAPCYEMNSANAEIVSGNTVDVGAIDLTFSNSDFTGIQVAGDFTSWDLGAAPQMTEEADCVWSDTLDVTAGDYFFKFVTDGAFDDPPDYGGDNSTVLEQPGGPHNTFLVAGPGTAIKVQVLVTGDYIFTLDETRQTFSTELMGTLPTGMVTGTVAFTGIDTGPFPEATVTLLEDGTSNVVRTGKSDAATGAFTLDLLPDGTYDLQVASPCFVTDTVTGITIAAGGTEDVGTVTLVEGSSAFTSIQLAGEVTDWELGVAPQMTEDPACVWTTTVEVNPGTYNFKLVTDGAFDSPLDYGGNEAQVLNVPGTFSVLPVSGIGTAIRIQVDAGDTYSFVLDERTQSLSITTSTPVEPVSWGRIKTRNW